RNVPQADAALKQGRWEKSRWAGVELHGKTLGVLGLGRIGTLVAQRAHSFGMRLVAWDPWMAPDRARQLGVDLLDLDAVFAQSDFVTLHLLKTPESERLIGRELLAKAKPGLRIVNAARGGIIDEDALAEAIRSGRIGGAAIDVFATEPLTESPLFGLANVVVTPHLAASTPEAQDKAGVVVAEQVGLALAGEFVPFAVNVEAAEASETVRPYMPLAERLGRIFAGLAGTPSRFGIEYQGAIADFDTRILTLSVLKGLFTGTTVDPVSYVNAPQVAAERGVEVRESRTTTAQDFVNLITLRSDDHSLAGTLTGLKADPRIVMLDGHLVEVPLSRHMLVVRNDDSPGRIGAITTLLGDEGINIDDMDVGRLPSGAGAMMVISTSTPVSDDTLAVLRAVPGILDIHALTQD
ncbi:MAG TPA: NAD(P)-dependent oxidoreductase, partial [Acidimicrobiales bacterium]|nr:NAD(P)-dependent oxidoreductase [Acidimicrobiales bacterium]